ncbi:MAG: MBL fold metallo-hydrolase [Paludibacteraceae bacterium]|nr:MBL fold metallo-hydrolase [Paludibacteraceae bacterium]
MKITIHRGKNQIGGCITEIESMSGCKIIIDLGHNLPKGDKESVDEYASEEAVAKLTDGVSDIFYTHDHGDHVGLFQFVPEGKNQYIGPLALSMMQKRNEYLLHIEEYKSSCENKLNKLAKFKTYKIARPINAGDIRVTPFAVSHSATDSYMLLVECDGKRVLHTGDFREHGYTGGKLIDVIEKYGIAGNIDVLITEGTNIGQADKKVMPEAEVQEEMLRVMKNYKNVFVLSSSADADRLESIWSAHKRRRCRPFVCDYYQKQAMAAIAEARKGMGRYYQFEGKKIYPYCSENVTLVNWMKDKGFTMMIRRSVKFQGYLDEILPWCRPEDTCLVYSQFRGYIFPWHEAFSEQTKAFVDQFPNSEYAHTSGHASKETLEKVCEAVNPKTAIIPIHKNAEADFRLLDISEELKSKIVECKTDIDGIKIVVN